MTDSLKARIKELDVPIPGERHAYVTVKKVLNILDEWCKSPETVKHLAEIIRYTAAVGMSWGDHPVPTFENPEECAQAALSVIGGEK